MLPVQNAPHVAVTTTKDTPVEGSHTLPVAEDMAENSLMRKLNQRRRKIEDAAAAAEPPETLVKKRRKEVARAGKETSLQKKLRER